MGFEQLQIDAFSEEAFRGNPAAVVFMDQPRDDVWKQNIAAENNLAETAFLEYIDVNNYLIRWFTPVEEVALCGHATLASGHFLYETNRVKVSDEIKFHTLKSGILTCKRLDNGYLVLNFPSTPVSNHSLNDKEVNNLIDGLDISKDDIVFLGQSTYDIVLEITPTAFSKLNPGNFKLLAALGGRGILVTSIGGKHSNFEATMSPPVEDYQYSSVFDKKFDFVSRCFFPRLNIDEDPVTGSAHCALAPYWSNKLQSNTFLAYQASKRGGVLQLEVNQDRISLSGKCITTIKSQIIV